jgi:uncharacterized protein YaeQ
MAGKFSFHLASADKRRAFPGKIIIGQRDTETTTHVLLKFFGYLLLFRERLQVEPRLHDDNIPYLPDLIQFDYTLRPALWVECGECSVEKLDRLAVKVPEAELWVVRRSAPAAEDILHRMAKHGLRRDRYRVVGLDADMFEEVEGLLRPRNEVYWVAGTFDPPQLQFDFNGLWFDAPFGLWRH